jgi:hypothetical protein
MMFRALRFAVRGLALAAALAAAGCVGAIPGAGEGGKPGAGGSSGSGPGPSGPGTGATGPGGTGGGAGPAAAGPLEHVPLRRLTRSQYNNTIRDLLGITGDVAQGFALDEQEGGFDANSRAPLKELQIERYQTVAEELATRAIANMARLAPCAPPARAEAVCLAEFLDRFGKRAYRRPLTGEEKARYTALFAVGKSGPADFAGGLGLVVSTMLQSPHFLYRPELGDPSRVAREGLPLTAWETASRLSYFIQNTMPDDDLFAAAEGDRLRTIDQVAAQARRLLATPQARETMVSFHQQWLQVDDLLSVEKDAATYPAWNPEVRSAMKVELDEFVDQVARTGDGKLETLLTAGFSYLSGPLYGLYGITGSGATPRRLDLPAGQRAGLFTLAGVMARHAHPDQSSLVGRGALVSDRLLCITPPSPPDDVDAMVPKPDPNVSTRLRFEQHRTDPRCAGCHALMDPLGIPFEIYDGIGKYRTMDGKQPVDATSALKGTDNDGPVADATGLMTRLAGTSQVRRCLTQQWFRYVFGRMDTDGDRPAIDATLSAFDGSGQKIPELMVALATSNAFRFRRAVDLP